MKSLKSRNRVLYVLTLSLFMPKMAGIKKKFKKDRKSANELRRIEETSSHEFYFYSKSGYFEIKPDLWACMCTCVP